MIKLRNKSAVSAVVGVVLMVAITIAIAATVYTYVGGIESKPSYNLNIQLNPPGYPELYSEWQITVWKIVNGTRYVGDNVTVAIEIYNEESPNNITRYEILTNNMGFCQFEYGVPEKHKFTASAEGYVSDFYEPAKKYIGSENIAHITNLFGAFGLIAIFSILITLYRFEIEPQNKSNKNCKKIKNILSKVRYSIFILLFLIFLIGVYFLSNLHGLHVSAGYPVDEKLLYLNIAFWTFIVLICIFITTFVYELKIYLKGEKT